MFGRGAWLYKQLERELAWERAQQKALDTCRNGSNAALIIRQYGGTLIQQAITRRSMVTSSGIEQGQRKLLLDSFFRHKHIIFM